MKTDKLYFGAAYYSEYLPYDRVEKDMEMMEKAGMNVNPYRGINMEYFRAAGRRV